MIFAAGIKTTLGGFQARRIRALSTRAQHDVGGLRNAAISGWVTVYSRAWHAQR